MSKQLVIFPRGCVSAKDRAAMLREGYLAIEADDPSKVILPLPAVAVTADTLLMSALIAMEGPGSTEERSKFTRELTRRLTARERASQPTSMGNPADPS